MSVSSIRSDGDRYPAPLDRHRRWRLTAADRVLAAAGAAEHGVEWPPQPQLTSPAERVPPGDGWLHEIKPGGCRLLVRVDHRGEIRLLCEGKDCSDRLPALAHSLQQLPVTNAILDAELVPRDRCAPDLRIFDLLSLDGFDLRGVPLLRRKQLLEALLQSDSTGALRYVDHVLGCGNAAFEVACALGAEGVVSRRVDSRYRSGPGEDWLETRCPRWEELERSLQGQSPRQPPPGAEGRGLLPNREMALGI